MRNKPVFEGTVFDMWVGNICTGTIQPLRKGCARILAFNLNSVRERERCKMEGSVIIYAVALWYSSYNRWGEKQNTLLKLWVSLSFRGTLVFTGSHFTAFLPLVFVIWDFFFFLSAVPRFKVSRTKSCWERESSLHHKLTFGKCLPPSTTPLQATLPLPGEKRKP